MSQPLGQHWLTDNRILSRIVDLVELKAGQIVVEIGTGTGLLTDHLLTREASIVSLEYDQNLYQQALKKYATVDSDRLRLQNKDVRCLNWSSMPENYKICANIPYYLSSNLLRSLTEARLKPQLSVLLLAKEVADKIAQKANRSLLSTLVQTYYQVDLDEIVSAQSFQPPPKIDSRIVVLRYAPCLASLSLEQWPAFAKFVKLGFMASRKQIGVNLSHSFKLDKDELRSMLTELSIPFEYRPGSLSHRQWWELFKCFAESRLIDLSKSN